MQEAQCSLRQRRKWSRRPRFQAERGQGNRTAASFEARPADSERLESRVTDHTRNVASIFFSAFRLPSLLLRYPFPSFLGLFQAKPAGDGEQHRRGPLDPTQAFCLLHGLWPAPAGPAPTPSESSTLQVACRSGPGTCQRADEAGTGWEGSGSHFRSPAPTVKVLRRLRRIGGQLGSELCD